MSRKKRPLPEDLGLPPGGADSHVHLDMGRLSESVDIVLARASSCGVSTLGNVFLGPKAYHQGRSLFDRHEQVFFILGIHPHEADSFSSAAGEEIIRAAGNDSRIRAVGETGLDFFYDHSPRPVQKEAFRAQLEIAAQLDLPVIIHSRDAYPQTMEILKDSGFRGRPLLWHCFGQGPEQAQEILSCGWHISIPGSITYKKNEALRRSAAIIPADRLVLETDCPFLAPEPYRGKPNEPALLGFTAQKIAEIKGMGLHEFWLECGKTCRGFFGLK